MSDTPESLRNGLTYADAGVDIDAGEMLVQHIKPLAKSTARPGSEPSLGGFGALFDLKAAGFEDPLIVATTDGVGTKLKIAIETGPPRRRRHRPGRHVRQRPAVPRAPSPCFFLDYYATGKLEIDAARRVVAGIAEGCRQAGCALVGGETAEMPGMYSGGDYDLAGFSLGAVERGHALPYLDRQQAGDLIIGIGSSGPHSNGYSLIRKVVEKSGLGWADDAPFAKDRSLAQALMEPTRIYVKPVLPLMKAGLVKGAAHITGGGLIENPPRCIAEGLQAGFDWDAWPMPHVFQWLGEVGGISDHELRRTFNCGIGFILIVSPENAEPVLEALLNAGEVAFVCGQLEAA